MNSGDEGIVNENAVTPHSASLGRVSGVGATHFLQITPVASVSSAHERQGVLGHELFFFPRKNRGILGAIGMGRVGEMFVAQTGNM